MLGLITHITLIIILSWTISNLWDMPSEYIKFWRENENENENRDRTCKTRYKRARNNY